MNKDSFARVALSFVPAPMDTEVQVRFRTRKSNAALVMLTAEQQQNALSIYVSSNNFLFYLV